MVNRSNHHAIVIGGSIAGLLAARVLSDHFERVTIIEKDNLKDQPEVRPGQPQANHLHGLLGKGLELINHYLPDLTQTLVDEGALLVDMGQTMRWYCGGGYRTRVSFKPEGIICSRPLLEWQIRRRVLALPNITVWHGCQVKGLTHHGQQPIITGAEVLRDGNQLVRVEADLVINAAGRGSPSVQWLTRLGYPAPEESRVTCNIRYTMGLYSRSPDTQADWIYISPQPPTGKRMGVAFPIEGNRWIISLAGQHGEQAPTDAAGFLAYAKSLPAPDVYNVIADQNPLSGFMVYHFPASLWRHYERLRQFPQGYLVLGDAVCSFNPIYGQGMTSAALQVAALDQVLTTSPSPWQGIAQPFFRQTAKIVNTCWQAAAVEDFRFPETQGKKPLGTGFINRYVTAVHRATHHDPQVGGEFLKVLNMMAPASSLFHPHIMMRVMGQSVWGGPQPRSIATTGSPQTL